MQSNFLSNQLHLWGDRNIHRLTSIVFLALSLMCFCTAIVPEKPAYKALLMLLSTGFSGAGIVSHKRYKFTHEKVQDLVAASRLGFRQDATRNFMPIDARKVRAAEESPAQQQQETPVDDFDRQVYRVSASGDVVAIAIMETLASHGADAVPVDLVEGLAFDRYILKLRKGIGFSKIAALSKDLQLGMELNSEPIITSTSKGVAIDVPKAQREFVAYDDVVNRSVGDRPTMAIGVDHLTRELIEVEFSSSSMENLVLGGLPRQGGKTSLIYSMMASLTRTPDAVKFVIFDGKGGVSFNFMKGHPMLKETSLPFEIAVDTEQGTQLITRIKAHIDCRYEVFRKVGVSHLDDYNERADEPMPYLMVIVDECQGVIDPKGEALKTWEQVLSICNAAGVGFIFATQRVDSNVIPEQINKKCASRIGLLVQSDKDSKYILNDLTAASKLLGKGDMIYRPGGASPMRLQSPYLSLSDVEAIFEVISNA